MPQTDVLTSSDWIQMIVAFACAMIASSGFWMWVIKRTDRNDLRTQLLIGLAHDRIIWLGMAYIERGSITQDEYENLHEYLYAPYTKMGGNGSAKRVVEAIEKLPIQVTNYSEKIERSR